MIVEVFLDGQRLDLFEDEGISITQGVQDVKDISKVFADFSQSFTVPASKRNNQLFSHYYNADILGGFDARTRKDAVILVNTLSFKRGKIQLEGVSIKDNEPANYKITFFGDVIKLKDNIGDDKLQNLDFLDNFNHNYDEAQVELGLTTGIDFNVNGVQYDKGIIYPLISYKRQYKYNSDAADTTSTDTLVNIAYDAGRSDGVKFGELKPMINLPILIDAIELQYGLNFTGGFFESKDFTDAYFSLNNSTESLNSGTLVFEEEEGIDDNSLQVRLRYQVDIIPKAGFENVPYKLKLELNGQTIFENPQFVTGINAFAAIVSSDLDTYKAKATIFTNSNFEFDAETQLLSIGLISELYFQNTYNNQVINLETVITDLIYDIKVYDLLTSIFKMFNLIAYSEGTDIVVEDLQTWYSEGRIIDISKYVDTKKLQVDRGVVYNRFNFLFEDSEQILADEFNRRARKYYGNNELNIYTDETQTELLDGESLDVEVLFERPVCERLKDENTNAFTNIHYLPYFNRELSTISGEPFLFYLVNRDLTANSIGFKGVSSYSEVTNAFVPSQQRDIDNAESFSLNFFAELSDYSGETMITNLFSKYYADYIGDIFSIRRRQYKLDAILPDEILSNLRLNDRLIINGSRYLINKITSNIVKRKDNIELINDIYDAPLATDVLQVGFRDAVRFYSPNEFSDSVQYVGDVTTPATLRDLGDGTGWVTIDNDPQTEIRTIDFTLAANSTGTDRSVNILITNKDKSLSTFTIIQR